MSDKSLKDKAIQIQGKDYVLVSDRIIYFNNTYPDGSIITELVSPVESDIVVVKATVSPTSDDIKGMIVSKRKFTGYSQAVKGAGFINKTAALENAETSAVGRALAMMGIGVIDSVASADEINKAQGTDPKVAAKKQALYHAFKKKGISDYQTQKDYVSQVLGKETVDSFGDAVKVINKLEADNEPLGS
jgi:hypothetical protein